jgi:hypothetical protein
MEEKLHLEVFEQKRLNTTSLGNPHRRTFQCPVTLNYLLCIMLHFMWSFTYSRLLNPRGSIICFKICHVYSCDYRRG